MSSIGTRSYQTVDDLQAMSELLLRCRATTPISRWPSVSELRLLCDPNRNDCLKQLWLTEDDALAAFALTFRNYAGLYFYIDPQWQETVLAEQIIAWAIDTHCDLGNGGKSLICQVREECIERSAFLETQGFQRQEKYVVRMACNLTEPLPAPQLPPGFTIRPVAGQMEAAARATVHERAFGREVVSAQSITERLCLMRTLNYIPELDLVVVAPDGIFAAFCQGEIDWEENGARGCKEGWTDPVGVHPAYRRLGLGKAVVLAACQQLRNFGIERALLGTGSWNTAMLRCAESAGYRPFYKSLWYSKPI